MFQNSYQNGTYFDLFDAKLSEDKLKALYRTVNVNGTNKVFDKELKTYVMQFTSSNAKMILPKEQKKDLYLIQQYLILQIYFHHGLSWNIELVISDLTKTKRRIVLSPASSKTEIKPFFIKSQCIGYKEGTWNNFIVDLYSFIEAFKGQTYRSLDAIYISGHFKMRRIYTSSSIPYQIDEEGHEPIGNQISFLPKHFYFPIDVPFVSKINRYNGLINVESISTIVDHSTKNSSFSKSNKTKINQIKINKCEEIIISHQRIGQQNKKIKKFLSNTNSQPLSHKLTHQRQQQKAVKLLKTEQHKIGSKSGEKYIKRKHLIKTQHVPIKTNQIIDKQLTKKHEDKEKTKAKLNPWRTNKKQNKLAKEFSQILVPKTGEDRSINTPETVSIFQGKNNLTSKFLETKNNNFESKCEQYSDSQYFQLSQKFSTLTDGKFFKNELINMTRHHFQSQTKHEEQDEQIEENIEMQANSMQSSANKQIQDLKQQKEEELIGESICGLNRIQSKNLEQKYEQLARSSLYGFGQQLMKHFMEDVQRPYSPPLFEKQATEQELSQNIHHDEKEEVQLIYDPVLNCYYDHRTHTYYELKN